MKEANTAPLPGLVGEYSSLKPAQEGGRNYGSHTFRLAVSFLVPPSTALQRVFPEVGPLVDLRPRTPRLSTYPQVMGTAPATADRDVTYITPDELLRISSPLFRVHPHICLSLGDWRFDLRPSDSISSALNNARFLSR